jgi:hypothetical protein
VKVRRPRINRGTGRLESAHHREHDDMQERRQRSSITVAALSVACAAALLAGCEPEVGSERWCEAMREKPRGDWTGNEALEYARSCILE